MSWYRQVHLTCDGGEYGCITEPDFTSDTVADIRERAKECGWKHEDGLDLCFICVYRRETGCQCEVDWRDDGKIWPRKDEHSTRDCPHHSMRERAKQRPKNFNQLSAREQWAIDKKLGILDWEGR